MRTEGGGTGGAVATLERVARVGVLIPATLACAAVADLALRTLPHDRFSFRAWEAVRTPGEEAPFLPNTRYHNDRTYGNLSAIGNLPAARRYRSVTLTTDALGYANPPGLGRAAAIVFGSSFAAGTEIGDDSTLAAQLGRFAGHPVYNAAADEPNFAEMRDLTRSLVAPGGLVILELPENRQVPGVTRLHVMNRTARCREGMASLRLTRACPAYAWITRHARVSPLVILSQHVLKRVEDGRWLPNPYAGLVLRERLRDGSEMLFLADERAEYHTRRSQRDAVRYYRWLASRLRLEGYTLLVVLVPVKYTVYAPLLERGEAGRDESAAYLDRLRQGLAAVGVPAVDLTAPLRAAAAAALERGDYVYYPDDTHWNAAGVVVAATAVHRGRPALP